MGLLENKVGENKWVRFNKRNLRFHDNFEIIGYIFNVGRKSNLSPKNLDCLSQCWWMMGLLENKVGENQWVRFNKRNLRFSR